MMYQIVLDMYSKKRGLQGLEVNERFWKVLDALRRNQRCSKSTRLMCVLLWLGC